MTCATSMTAEEDVHDSNIGHHIDNDENDNSPDGDAVDLNSADHINLHTGDLDTVVWRSAQLEQENSELHAEVLVLKRTIDTLNSSVQRLNLSLLTDYQVQMYTGLPRKIE